MYPHYLLYTEWSEAERIAYNAERNVFFRTISARDPGSVPSDVECREAATLRNLANSLLRQLTELVDEVRATGPAGLNADPQPG